jgi:Kef-type K+ transport system membrane component KefB
VLTRPADTTELLEDAGLLNDLLQLVIACFLAGALCTSLGLPAFVGYVCAGTLLGPAGLNVVSVRAQEQPPALHCGPLTAVRLRLVQAIVQITTIGDLGVFFVLFSLGMEVRRSHASRRTAGCGAGSTALSYPVAVFVGQAARYVSGGGGGWHAFHNRHHLCLLYLGHLPAAASD